MTTSSRKFVLCLIALSFSMNLHASEAADSTSIKTVPLNKTRNDDKSNDKHFPHKSPAKEGALPTVCFNPINNSLIFSSVDFVCFAYTIYDCKENIVCDGMLNISRDHTETIFIPENTIGEYSVIIDINGLLYRGEFEIEEVF